MLQLTKVRKERGLSMSALARLAGMHASSVSQIENGRLAPYPSQKEKLVRALGWIGDAERLFGEVEDR